jgi:uncharacterized protein (DUF362 family)
MIRKMFFMYNLDRKNYGTTKWNPLSEIVSKGNTVLIKPNLVRHRHPLGKKAVESTITNSSLLRPIIDYTILALNGEGEIIICDAPFASTDFDKACEISRLKELVDFYTLKVKDLHFSLIDLRSEKLNVNANVMKMERYLGKKEVVTLEDDPLGYTPVDLKDNSFHSNSDADWKLYAITDERMTKIMKHYHTAKKHCYLIPNSVLAADAIISVPKLKSHRKAGITLALKNFVGICSLKSCLPHHKIGCPQNGGDEYPCEANIYTSIKDKLITYMLSTPGVGRIARKMLWERFLWEAGGWYGNDTIWRTVLDLNLIVKYANKEGILCKTPQRKFLFIADGIIGQENEGPVLGHPKKCGVTLLGTNPCAVDYVAAKLVGFDVNKIKQISVPFERKPEINYPLVNFDKNEIDVVTNIDEYAKIHMLKREKSLKFLAAKGWKILEKVDSSRTN